MTNNEPPLRAGAAPPACPGCRAAAVSLVDTVATSELAQLYRGIGVEVGAYFQGIGRIARLPGVRDALAARVAREKPQLRNGHTVVLVARKERVA